MTRIAGVITGVCVTLYIAWAAITAALALVVNLLLLGTVGLLILNLKKGFSKWELP
jgi:hypothetical protein